MKSWKARRRHWRLGTANWYKILITRKLTGRTGWYKSVLSHTWSTIFGTDTKVGSSKQQSFSGRHLFHRSKDNIGAIGKLGMIFVPGLSVWGLSEPLRVKSTLRLSGTWLYRTSPLLRHSRYGYPRYRPSGHAGQVNFVVGISLASICALRVAGTVNNVKSS